IIYSAPLRKQKITNPTAALKRRLMWKRFFENKTPAKSRRFFVHCLGRKDSIIEAIIKFRLLIYSVT
ncbi:MAG: hypothetical protein DRP89_06810, partial [Candidatus Neomarinimicrobiota bacterium]